MIICDCYSNCIGCDWKCADRKSDIDNKFHNCSHLMEVEPVRHGRWIELARWSDGRTLKCTACGSDTFHEHGDATNFCPNCSAKMDGDVDAD